MKGKFVFGNPVISLQIEDKRYDLILDTGFDGYLMLSPKIIEDAKFKMIGFADYLNVTGEKVETEVYKGQITFLGKDIEIPIISSDFFNLAGMDLFHKHKIIIHREKGILEINWYLFLHHYKFVKTLAI